jgi:hypothetical protein
MQPMQSKVIGCAVQSYTRALGIACALSVNVEMGFAFSHWKLDTIATAEISG